MWVDRNGVRRSARGGEEGLRVSALSPDGSRLALDIRDAESDIWVWTSVAGISSVSRLIQGSTGVPCGRPTAVAWFFPRRREGQRVCSGRPRMVLVNLSG